MAGELGELLRRVVQVASATIGSPPMTAFFCAPMISCRCASCSVFDAGAEPHIDSHIVARLPVARIDCAPTDCAAARSAACVACLRIVACRSMNRSLMPVSANMRAISFTFACEALNIWLAMVATWFCSAFGSTPWPCRLTPVRHSRVASMYCIAG